MSVDFIDNKYRRWYLQLCDRARGRALTERGERHHVLPRSLGGGDEAANLVALTFREHFLAHWLLTKFTSGDDRRRMSRALGCMTYSRTGRLLTSWQYARSRKACYEASIGRKFKAAKRSAEVRAKMAIANRQRSPEARAKLSAAARNRSPETREKLRVAASNPSPEDRAKKSAAAKARRASAETRAKISAAMMGHKRCVGRKLSAETKAKIGAASRNRSPESNAKIAAAQRANAARRKAAKAAGL